MHTQTQDTILCIQTDRQTYIAIQYTHTHTHIHTHTHTHTGHQFMC